jgi:transcriptional regulator with XRE-family HTH domain
MIKKTIGIKIKEAVKKAGFKQQNFARKIGIGESMISQWAAGSKNPSLMSLKKISKATGVPLNFFLNDSIGDINGSDFSINTVGKGNINTSKDMELLKKEIELLKKELEIVKKEKELLKRDK